MGRASSFAREVSDPTGSPSVLRPLPSGECEGDLLKLRRHGGVGEGSDSPPGTREERKESGVPAGGAVVPDDDVAIGCGIDDPEHALPPGRGCSAQAVEGLH